MKITRVLSYGYRVRVLTGERARYFKERPEATVYVCERELKPVPAKREKEAEKAAKKPFEPFFRVGDVVRTNDGFPFSRGCQNCVAIVRKVYQDTRFPEGSVQYDLAVVDADGRERYQTCHEHPGVGAPMELLLRGGERHD